MLARELAKALEEAPELAAFRETEDALLADPEAVRLIGEFEAGKRAVKFSKNKPPEEQMQLIEHFMAIEEQFNVHPLIQAYSRARDNLDLLMERINAVITYPITGAEAPPRKSGCGSGGEGGCGCGT